MNSERLGTGPEPRSDAGRSLHSFVHICWRCGYDWPLFVGPKCPRCGS